MGDLLEMQILGPHPRPDDSRSSRGGPSNVTGCTVLEDHMTSWSSLTQPDLRPASQKGWASGGMVRVQDWGAGGGADCS